MADNNADLLQQLKSLAGVSDADTAKAVGDLTQVVKDLKQVVTGMSQSAFKDMRSDRTKDQFRNQYLSRDFNFDSRDFNKHAKVRLTDIFDEFADSLEDSLLEAITGGKFKGALNTGLENVAKAIGVETKDIGKVLGRAAGRRLANTSLGQAASGRVQSYLGRTTSTVEATFYKGMEKRLAKLGKSPEEINALLTQARSRVSSARAATVPSGMSQAAAGASSQSSTSIGSMLSTIAPGGGAQGEVLADAALSGLADTALKFAPQIALVVAGMKAAGLALSVVTKEFKEIKEAFANYTKSLIKSATRDAVSKKENTKLAQQRLVQDVETLIKEPFEILKDAAQAAYDVWDNNLRKIAATQGYEKADVQSLLSAFSQRLRDEGLSDVISGTNIVDSLSSVLESGLSGAVAEEFAYRATLLNAAVPTQDFFGYASTYASVAANAIKAGKSEADALAIANQSLTEFANNLLYASRELAGGYTTGLKDATDLYEKSVKIAQAARGGDVTQISGVLTAVAGIVGATAPDLATALTDAVYQAAVGGNNSSLVALRSMAGVNASNTEFLRQLATNPQKLFTDLFTNLANMYNSSSDAFMEKAEGYAELFGLSSEVFQRVDFNYLADAIAQMNVGSAELDQNMKLLASGQTTLTKEQLVNRQINEYLIDEGLAYVLDNAAARSVQEHMWEEQIARELMEAEYGVELKGAGKELLSTISAGVSNIITLLTPFGWIKGAKSARRSENEASQLENSLYQVLELGKVGKGREKSLHDLTTRGAKLELAQELTTLLGYQPSGSDWWSPSVYSYSNNDNISLLVDLMYRQDEFMHAISNRGPKSKYKWNVVSKSASSRAADVLSALGQGGSAAMAGIQSGTSASAAAQSAVTANIEKMLSDEYLKNYIGQASYEDWAASASKFGISNFDSALEAAGYSEADIRQFFKDKETEKGAEEQNEIRKHEKLFRDTGITFWDTNFWEKYQTPEFEKIDAIYEALTNFNQDVNDHYTDLHDNYLMPWNLWRVDPELGWVYHTTTLDSLYTTSGNILTGMKELAKVFIDSGDTRLVAKIKKSIVDGLAERLKSAYKQAYGDGEDFNIVAQVQAQSQKENSNALQALTDVLTTQLEAAPNDPALQTNAILAEILKQLQYLNASTNSGGLPNTLQGLATGR